MSQQLVRRLRAAGCVFAEREADLLVETFGSPAEREAAVVRRESGEPLEHVLGWAQFGEVRVEIGPNSFIPRARALALVDAADEVTTTADAPVLALDLGCGVGAIAAALCHRHRDWDVHACDVDTGAATVARRNAATFGFVVHTGCWFDGLPAELKGGIDIVVAHLPYVPTAEIDRLARDFRDHEPRHSVDGGVDGLDPLREVAPSARDWLAPTGLLLTQVHRDQQEGTAGIATATGMQLTTVPPLQDQQDEHNDEDTLVLALRRTDTPR